MQLPRVLGCQGLVLGMDIRAYSDCVTENTPPSEGGGREWGVEDKGRVSWRARRGEAFSFGRGRGAGWQQGARGVNRTGKGWPRREAGCPAGSAEEPWAGMGQLV